MPHTPTSGANVADIDLQVLPGYPAGERTYTWHSDLAPPATPKLRVGVGDDATVYTGILSGQSATFDLPDLATRVGLPVVLFDDLGSEEEPDEEPRVAGEVIRWAGGSAVPSEVLIRPTAAGVAASAVPSGGPRGVQVIDLTGTPDESVLVDLSDVSQSIATVVVLVEGDPNCQVQITALPALGTRGAFSVKAVNAAAGWARIVCESLETATLPAVRPPVLELSPSADDDGTPSWVARPRVIHHNVGGLLQDTDMAGGDFDTVYLVGAGEIPRVYLVGVQVALLTGDDATHIWTITDKPDVDPVPCVRGIELNAGELVTTGTGYHTVAQALDGITVGGLSVQVPYQVGDVADWSDPPPNTVDEALNRIANAIADDFLP